MCRNFNGEGTCKWGDNCIFAHGKHELRIAATADGHDSAVDDKVSVVWNGAQILEHVSLIAIDLLAVDLYEYLWLRL